MSPRAEFDPRLPVGAFSERHLGPSQADVAAMLAELRLDGLEALVEEALPADIRREVPLALPLPASEHEALARLRAIAAQNLRLRSFIGMGYTGCLPPAVIVRNILENPGWYTAYTPYQAEIAQGRLEALLNFQTMVGDLCALPLCNASLLDEATAAAEAMTLCHRAARAKRTRFFAAADCHPQTLAVVRTRAEALGFEVVTGDPQTFDFAAAEVFGALVQYPGTYGRVLDMTPVVARVHAAGALVVMACDLLSLVRLRPPGEWGADVAIGTAQRFGTPMAYGGPHAAFLATKEEYKRHIPGRVIGVSRDAQGRPALRMAMQTREQHIRREKATSNICTAQVLLAVIASMYGVYHGPEGLERIAGRVHHATSRLAAALVDLGLQLEGETFFDTLTVRVAEGQGPAVVDAAVERGINLRPIDARRVGLTLDETVSEADLDAIFAAFGGQGAVGERDVRRFALPEALRRQTTFMTHPVFHRHRSEHDMLRYIRRLEARDLSLTTSMIPLGSCTMKLNATTEMIPVTWPEFAELHPFAPREQARGYQQMIGELEAWLAEITGFAAVSVQPNSGAQGEYAGLMVVRAYHRAQGQAHRNVCLIPVSAHGTNPASAVMAGMSVVVVGCDESGNIDVDDLRRKAEAHRDRLAALMVTYPSTHGVFEATIREICEVVHAHGGLVYLDGANLNAQVGLCRPGDYGADVCHLNLHKTFCIPHGGGGPGVGPIGVTARLAPFLPGHPVVPCGGARAVGPIAAAPWGSAGILPIPYLYIAMMGAAGLTRATEVAILNANYMAHRLAPHFPILYTGASGRVAHEFIVDLRGFKGSAGIEAEDVAKRLMDYGFHAPTMSFPVAGTLMIEPTESEPKAELDRFCDALIAIRAEIAMIERGEWPRGDNPLKNAPHTAAVVTASTWTHPYDRERAAYPAPWLREHKYWPPVGRIDNAWGDRNLVCACLPTDAYADASP